MFRNLCLCVALAAICVTAASVVAPEFQFPSMCPKSNPEPTACYCTNGCSVNGEGGFPWLAPVWPPALKSASFVGRDTICAKITVPQMTSIAGKAFSAWLGITGDVRNNGKSYAGPVLGSETTIYTAFTQAQCLQFHDMAQAALSADSDTTNKTIVMRSLKVKLCTTAGGCNTVKPIIPTQAASSKLALFPGVCPVSNPNPTGCFCTSGCAWDFEAGGFP